MNNVKVKNTITNNSDWLYDSLYKADPRFELFD